MGTNNRKFEHLVIEFLDIIAQKVVLLLSIMAFLMHQQSLLWLVDSTTSRALGPTK